ncbi:MAG: DUF6962 family protein [Burkholderiales bacterium]
MALIALALLVLTIALLAQAPIAQFADFHALADQRTLAGVPNFWNVASNLPFLVVGWMGLDVLRRRPPGASPAWAALFWGTLLVFFGSSYYHLAPDDATLVWDRLPIGIGFMGFFVALLCEHAGQRGQRVARRLLFPLIAFSIGSVYWWRFTGDLSLYVWVQLAPMLAVVLALALLPAQYSHRRYFAYALGCYAAAKLFELGDHQLLQWTGGMLSGHTLKHLAAAAGVYCIYAMLKKRTPIP